MSRIQIIRASRINTSCHTCERVESQMWVNNITHVNELCYIFEYQTCEWVVLHMWILHISMSNITRVNEKYHTCRWVMSHIYMGHINHIYRLCHTYVMSHVRMGHVTHVCMGLVTHTYESWDMAMRDICVTHIHTSRHTYKRHTYIWAISHM